MTPKPPAEPLPFSPPARLDAGVLKLAGPLESTAQLLVVPLCRWFGCEWGAYWQVDEARHVIRPVVVWNKGTIDAEKLRKSTETRHLRSGEGNAGRVWRNGKPVCTANLITDMCLPRSLDASAAGLKAGIWFPVKTGEITVGVIELLGQHGWRCDGRFLHELAVLGCELGGALKGEHPGTANEWPPPPRSP